MTAHAEIDHLLTAWQRDAFNDGPVKPVPQRAGITGLKLLYRRRVQVSATPHAIRGRLTRLAKRTPQVVVRISGGGRGMGHIRAHWLYITRNGRLAAQDHNKDMLIGSEDLAALEQEWRHGGFPIAEKSGQREAFNIVLSMPAGTDPRDLQLAAAEFAADEFEGHQYVMVLHTLDNDHNASPSPNPHIHLCVKSRGEDGVRLNPRKGDLQRWREGFAERLRERGIDAAASRRVERFQRQPGIRQSEVHLRGRGQLVRAHHGLSVQSGERWAKAELQTMERLGRAAAILATADDAEDRKLAIGLIAACERAPQRRHEKPIER